MKQFHKHADEKRMLVILPEPAYDEWLVASPQKSGEFLVPFEAAQFEASA